MGADGVTLEDESFVPLVSAERCLCMCCDGRVGVSLPQLKVLYGDFTASRSEAERTALRDVSSVFTSAWAFLGVGSNARNIFFWVADLNDGWAGYGFWDVYNVFLKLFYFAISSWKDINPHFKLLFIPVFLSSRSFNIVLTALSKCVNLASVQMRRRLFIASHITQWPHYSGQLWFFWKVLK